MKNFAPQDIIGMNIELQTVQRELRTLGVYKPSLELFTSDRFKNSFRSWEEGRKEKFTRLVSGGQKYFKMVKGYYEQKTI